MPSPVELQCPHCGTRLRLKNRENLGRKFRCRNCRQVFRGTEVDSDVIHDAELDEDSEFELPQSARGDRRKKLRQLTKLHKKRLVVGAVGLLLVAGLFLLPWRSITRAINKVNPLADTRQSLFSALKAERLAADKAIISGNKEEDREAAGKELDKIVTNIEDIFLRALRMEPWTKEDAAEFVESKKDPNVFDFKAAMPAGAQGRRASRSENSIRPGDPRFSPSIRIDVLSALTAGTLLEIEPPLITVNPGDETEIELIDEMRDALDAITRSTSASAMANTAEDLESQAATMQKLFAQLQTERAHVQNVNRSSTTEYHSIRSKLLQKMQKAEEILRDRYNADDSLARAIEKIEDIDPTFDGDQW